MDVIYMRSRKRQDLLSKLGIWGRLERIEGEDGGRKWRREIYIAQKKTKMKPHP